VIDAGGSFNWFNGEDISEAGAERRHPQDSVVHTEHHHHEGGAYGRELVHDDGADQHSHEHLDDTTVTTAHNHGHGQSLDHEHAATGHAHTGLRAEFQHLLTPHSHDAADVYDPQLAGSAEGIRAVQVSLVALGLTAALQLVVALASGSVAVLADTIHNFADASTAIPLWLAFSVGRRPPNDCYTYGYGRAEDLAGIFVLLMIVGSAGIAFWESLQRLFHPTPIQNLPWVAAAGLVGFIGNELVARYRISVGRRIGSAALVADGYHARTDGLTSLSVVVGAAGVWLGFPIADPLVGMGITLAILLVLKDASIRMWRRLMDAVDPQLVAQVAAAARAAEGVEGVSTVRARWIGHAIHAEALIVADAKLTLAEAHEVAERARHKMLHAVPRLSTVTVHVDPSASGGVDYHAELAHHDRPAAEIGRPEGHRD
jgi:cation diffusion facilitator family transporter